MSIALQTHRRSLLQVKLLTKNARRLYDLGMTVLPGLTESSLRKTFFGHFCAGTAAPLSLHCCQHTHLSAPSSL